MIISDSEAGYKDIDLGKENADSVYKDLTEHGDDEIHIDGNGKDGFTVNARSVGM
ncbi:hypothetical protein [Chryseobacterium sp. CP-77]|uniref:hypothetical protein n=1 Tax=Chryseobacterium sp. CP-77 TaxID=3116594 RepID=UPI002ED033C9